MNNSESRKSDCVIHLPFLNNWGISQIIYSLLHHLVCGVRWWNPWHCFIPRSPSNAQGRVSLFGGLVNCLCKVCASGMEKIISLRECPGPRGPPFQAQLAGVLSKLWGTTCSQAQEQPVVIKKVSPRRHDYKLMLINTSTSGWPTQWCHGGRVFDSPEPALRKIQQGTVRVLYPLESMTGKFNQILFITLQTDVRCI